VQPGRYVGEASCLQNPSRRALLAVTFQVTVTGPSCRSSAPVFHASGTRGIFQSRR